MLKRKAVIPLVAMMFASVAAAASVAPATARGGALADVRQRQSQLAGGQDDMFRRHFFRGQAYHGTGYAAQMRDLPRGAGRAAPASLEAVVEPGTPGAAIARAAAECSARFKSYDASTGTYIGRGGAVRRCP